MIWRKYRSSKNDPALSIVGADLRVCPGFGMRHGAGADTQVCPYDKRRKIFASLISFTTIILLWIAATMLFAQEPKFALNSSGLRFGKHPRSCRSFFAIGRGELVVGELLVVLLSARSTAA